MPNGKLEDTPINRAVLYLLAEWQKQEKEHKYKIHRLRALIRNLGGAVVDERDRTQLIETPAPGFSLDPMVKQSIDRGKQEL